MLDPVMQVLFAEDCSKSKLLTIFLKLCVFGCLMLRQRLSRWGHVRFWKLDIVVDWHSLQHK